MEVELGEDDCDALLLEDGGTIDDEFSSNDVEFLLGDEELPPEDDLEVVDDSEEPLVTEGGEEDSTKTKTPTDASPRGRGDGRRFFNGHRGGGRRMRMPMGPPGFFRGGMRPPFPGAVPPFGRHPVPFGFRGRPMMRPPHFFRHPRAMMHMRGSRPPYPYKEEEDEDEEEDEEEEGKSEEAAGSGPKPLMSIKTPKELRKTVKAQIATRGSEPLAAPLGMGMGPRFHVMRGTLPPPMARGHPPGPRPPGGPPVTIATRGGRGGGSGDHRGSIRPSLKRPYGDQPTNSGAPRAEVFAGRPIPDRAPLAASGSVRSNLKHISTVDEPMQTAPPVSYRPTPRASFTVSHKPAPALTQIRTVDSSAGFGPADRPALRPASASGQADPSSRPVFAKVGGMSTKVFISNLPDNMSFARISAMTTACGSVRTINIGDDRTAIVEFSNVGGVENFIRTNNRKVIDRCAISVARLV